MAQPIRQNPYGELPRLTAFFFWLSEQECNNDDDAWEHRLGRMNHQKNIY